MVKNIISLAALAIVTGSLGLAFPTSAFASPEEDAIAVHSTQTIDEEVILEDQGTTAVSETSSEAETVDTEAEDEAEDEAEAFVYNTDRQGLVSYALQFVGGQYRAGGNDPHTGADCSGFVKYIMQYGAGITLNRSSAAQSTQGVAISVDEMQPGDLIFYSNGSRINHVAMYIGDGQIVHASTQSTGIKVSPWDYRAPAKITNVLGF